MLERLLEIPFLDFQRGDGLPRLQLQRRRTGDIPRHALNVGHRFRQFKRRVQFLRADQRQHQAGGAHLQCGGVGRHVGVAQNQMQTPVILRRVRLVPGIDDGPLGHRLDTEHAVDEIGALRQLETGEPVFVFSFRSDLSGSRVQLPRHQKRYQMPDPDLERQFARDQVIVMRAVTVPAVVGVVFKQL